MSVKTFTLRGNDELQQRADESEEDWFRRQVQIGMDSDENEESIPADVMEAKAAAWRAGMLHKVGNKAA